MEMHSLTLRSLNTHDAGIFDLVSDRLNEDGVFIMNFMDKVDRLDAFAALVTTLRQVFPQVEVWTEATNPMRAKGEPLFWPQVKT